MANGEIKFFGNVVGGSLSGDLEIRLDPDVPQETIKVGRLVVVEGERYFYFGIVSDVALGAAGPEVLSAKPNLSQDLIRRSLLGTNLTADATVRPMLSIPKEAEVDGKIVPADRVAHRTPEALAALRSELGPARSLPPHFAPTRLADKADMELVFGAEEEERMFAVGTPMEMDELPLCIDLARLAERSTAVFGKTGTGKTYLVLVILTGLIRSGAASALVFDMHNDYGWTVKSESAAGYLPGLRQAFGNKITVYSLDPESTKSRGGKCDVAVEIPYGDVQINDVLLLGDILNLPPTAPDTLYLLYKNYPKNWLAELLTGDRTELLERTRANEASLEALYRRLAFLERLGYLRPEPVPGAEPVENRLFDDLQAGKSVVVEFGRYGDLKSYLLVANIVARRLHDRYVEATERAVAAGTEPPRQLVMVLEEAHRFLAPTVAENTVFGTVAREMRKFHVTLTVIDQRPSAIDDEVLSQIGTRFVGQLSDDRDLGAVTVGAAGGAGLRAVLATLEGSRQVLVFGHAVPMPVVMNTRTYDEEFLRVHGGRGGGKKTTEEDVKRTFG
jgi:DNA helicase HerA-like ATPase